MARDRRRLAAIVSADVAGYSRLMSTDESGTLADLKAHRRELIDPKIAEFGGRVVKSTGDGLLMDFPSVVDAVRCAVDVQRGMAERNATVEAEHRIEFRVGINVGDIIIDGDDIYGDGVNIAARLQMIADPGGICVSKVVRDQVLDKLSFSFEDLGAQHVKNIPRPVEVYRVDLRSEPLPTTSSGRRRWQRAAVAWWRWVVTGVVVSSLVGMAFWMLPQLWKSAPMLVSAAPAVAVLPFTAPRGSPAEEQFAEVLTRDLTSALGKELRLTQLVAHDLVAPYKGHAFDARSVGRELSVSYLVEGEVRRVGERIVLSVQLVDTGNATQLWNDRLELDPTRLGDDQSKLVSRLANRIQSGLSDANERRFAGQPAANAGPVELTLHALSVWYRDNNTLRGALEARKWFDQALRIDPGLVPAMLGRVRTLIYELDLDPSADASRILQEMDKLTFRAISIDNSNPSAWTLRAETLMRQRRWEAALEANAKNEKLSASPGWAFNQRAGIMIFIGRPEEALALVERQLETDPQDQEELGWVMLQRCRAYMALGRYDQAIAACERDIALDDWWLPHLYLVAGYALKDATSEAAAEKTTLIKLRPTVSIAEFKKLYYSDNPEFVRQTEAHLLTGLRKAGVPEN